MKLLALALALTVGVARAQHDAKFLRRAPEAKPPAHHGDGRLFPEYAKGYRKSSNFDPSEWPVLSREEVLAGPRTPERIDWVERGATTKVKDQGSCGSCWAFGTTEAVESSLYLATGNLVELSTEELVDCDKTSLGCGGGDIPEAVRYFEEHGVDSATDYPDESSHSGRTQECTWDGTSVATVTGMTWAVPPCAFGEGKCDDADEDVLAAAVAKYGPLAICVNANSWNSYRGGVVDDCSDNANMIDHCVSLVGYDKNPANGDKPYWKVRNSWGTSWGEDGFIRLAMGSNTCCVACEPAIIAVEAAS